jgi:hypothetical protein
MGGTSNAYSPINFHREKQEMPEDRSDRALPTVWQDESIECIYIKLPTYLANSWFKGVTIYVAVGNGSLVGTTAVLTVEKFTSICYHATQFPFTLEISPIS